MMMMINIIILILIVSVPAAYGHAVIVGSSPEAIDHDHPPNEFESTYAQDMGLAEWFGVRAYVDAPQNYTELMCENPDEKGFCFKAIPASAISDGIILLIVLVSAIAVTVLIIFGKDISKFIKKDRQ